MGLGQPLALEESNHAQRRLSGLDTLRGVAILLVMVGHFSAEVFTDFYPALMSSISVSGVVLFFYLSGFLIFRNVQAQPPVVFLLRRFAKLFPAYWVNIAVITALAVLLQTGQPTDFLTLFSNALMIQEFTSSPLMNNVYWTLQIELKFYLIMLLFVMLFGARRIYVFLAFLLLADVLCLSLMGRGSTLITYLLVFFPGIAAARGYAQSWNPAAVKEFMAVTLLVSIALFFFLPPENVLQAFYAPIFSALLYLALKRDMASRFFAFFGKISYSHYLYHTAIGYLLIRLLMDMNGSGVMSSCLALVVAMVVTVSISTLSFFWIERPAMDWGHRFEAVLRRINWPRPVRGLFVAKEAAP